MASNSIVETLDVIEDVRLGFSPCAVNSLLDLLALQVAEERLSHRVIPAVTATAHARAQSVVFAPAVELIAAKLATLVRMDDHRVFGPSAPHRHRQSIQHQARLHAWPHAPAHHCTRVQVQHSRQIQPAFKCAYVRDIRHQSVVGFVVLELALQLVGRNQ